MFSVSFFSGLEQYCEFSHAYPSAASLDDVKWRHYIVVHVGDYVYLFLGISPKTIETATQLNTECTIPNCTQRATWGLTCAKQPKLKTR